MNQSQSTLVLIFAAVLVVLILSSRNLGAFWTVMYKLGIGAISGGVCLFVLEKVDTTDEVKWVSSVVVGIFVTIAATGIPWR